MLVGSTLPRPDDDRAACGLAFAAHRGDERIVAAGVENDQPEPLGAIGRETSRSSGIASSSASRSLASLASTGIR